MSNPSRNDKAELLTGVGVSEHFKKECFAEQGMNIMSVEVRTRDEKSPLLPGTKCILFLGKEAADEWTHGQTINNTLGEIRGSPYEIEKDGNKYIAIPSYLPQDCVDRQDYESTHNELLSGQNILEEEKEREGSEKRRHGVTSRSNWRFWLKADCAKLFRILANDGKVPARPFEPKYRIWPEQDEIIDRLTNTKNEELFLDIETDSNLSITCCGLGFSSDKIVYVLPFVDHRYNRSYSHLPHILRALSVAIRDNTVVAHNGAAFDFFVLGHKYRLSVGWNLYDTMLAQHRCFPEIEKSLGHCTSLWTYEPFHKDESYFNFSTPEQFNQLMRYCGKDVYTMMLIKKAIDEYARTIPGLTASIAQVNSSIRPYLTMLFQGVHFKEELRAAVIAENDVAMTEYIRNANILVGPVGLTELGRKNKTSLLASPQKLVHYFHDMLEYPIVGRSKRTGLPSLGKQNIYKLRLRVENPVLDLCLRYREAAKESGSLKFTEWRDADGKLGVEKEEL